MSIDFDEPTVEENEGGNRLFVILAVGLAGLVVLGLIAIGGVLILRNIRSQQAIAQITPEATPTLSVVEQLPTPTYTPTPITPTPTVQTSPTATNTPVVLPTNTPTDAEATATAAVPVTNTPVPVGTPVGDGGGTGGGDSGEEVPDTGVGGAGLVAIALGLVSVLAVSRRLRHAV